MSTASPSTVAPTRPRTQFALANGLRVVVEEDHVTPAVAVNLWYGVGSRHEEKGLTGLAHLFEHLMFEGSQNVAGGEHFALLDAVGSDLNATTSFDRTNYFETVPTEAFELALWLEADRLGGLLAALDQKNLDNQRDVVRNERRQRMDNQPYGTGHELLFKNTFPEGHQYHHMPIGSMADVTSATLDDVRNFFIRHYSPSNAVLSLVGAISPEDAEVAVERYFGGIDPKQVPPQPELQAFSTGGARVDITDEEVPAPMVYMGWAVPADGTDTADALDLAAPIIGGAESSILQRELVRRTQSATTVYAGQERMVGGQSMFMIVAQGRDGVEPQQLVDEISTAISRLGLDAPTTAEVSAARASTESSFLAERETLAGRADSLSHGLCLFGDPGYDDTTLEAIRVTGADEVADAVRAHLVPDAATIIAYTPPSARQTSTGDNA